MSMIKSGASSDLWTIDPLSKAGRVTPYAPDGTVIGESPKATYGASILGLAVAAIATDIFTLTGSASKTIRVSKIECSGIQLAAGVEDIQLVKRSTANSGGTSSAPAAVPLDSNDAAATATPLAYTANPTLGTLVGVIRSEKAFLPTSGGSAPPTLIRWLFGGPASRALVLRGVNQVLAINLNAITIAGGNFAINIEWTEE